MNKETLEEAMMKDGYFESDYDKIWREGVQFGAKWQEERMYSEENMINFSIWVYLEIGQNTGKARTNKELFQEWLEQNKKK